MKLILAILLLVTLSRSALFAAPDDNRILPRVLSINLCADQLVMLLADPAQITALSSLSQDEGGSYFRELAKQFPQAEPSAEAILPRSPDVVLTGPYTSRYTLALLDELGVRVESLVIANSMEAMLSNIAHIGQVLNQQEKAASVMASLRQRLVEASQRVDRLDAALAANALPRPRAAIYDANGYTVGKDSLRGEAVVLAGWHNVAEDRGIESYGVLQLEELIQLRPSVLIESPYRDGTYSRGQMKVRHPAIRQSGLNPEVITLPSEYTLCAGPWSVSMLEQLLSVRESIR